MASNNPHRAESYDGQFFDQVTAGSVASARFVVPLLADLLQPRSVLDVGCAEGAWLSIFDAAGVKDYLGMDGAHVNRSRLLIDPAKFSFADLENEFALGRRFDLVICLEVAEHLSAAAGEKLVASLAAHADCVAFSAAVPHQDGTLHINEQWPAYWSQRFQQRGFEAYDCLRPRLWNEPAVCWWFAQNLILYAMPKFAAARPQLGPATGEPLPLVHPQLMTHWFNRFSQSQNENQEWARKTKSSRWLFNMWWNRTWSRLRKK